MTKDLKYMQIAQSLKDYIKEQKIQPGDKIDSENILATRYNVSRFTVRKALAVLEDEGYIEAIHGVGTFCSKRIGMRGESKNIAVVTTYISDYIFPRVIQGIDKVLSEKGYSIILKNTNNSRMNERKILEDILTKDIDGIVIEPSKSQILCRNVDLYKELDKLNIPYVFIQGSYMQLTDKPHVILDDEKGSYLLTQHLIETGHKNIVGIFKADDSQGKERHKGYVKALSEYGFPYNPEMVVWFHTEDRKVKPSAFVSKMVKEHTKMDAIVCYNDQVAMEVYKVLQTLDLRVPEDVSLTGYDNSYNSENSILQLTTIAHPQEKLGEMAAELLLKKISGEWNDEVDHMRVIEPVLVLGNSCCDR